MEIYIIRHAHAVAGKDDVVRPLSVKGRKQVKEMAAFGNDMGANRLIAVTEPAFERFGADGVVPTQVGPASTD